MQVTFSEKEIRSLLEKVRAFDNTIGSYDFFALNSAFDYVVKVSNGTIVFHVNELIANDSGEIPAGMLSDIAGRFIPEGMISPKTVPIASKNGMKSGVVLMITVAALVFGGILVTVLRNDRNSKRVYIENKTPVVSEEEIANPPVPDEDSYEVAHMPTPEEARLEEENREIKNPFEFIIAETSFKVTLIGNVQVEGAVKSLAANTKYKNVTVRMKFYNKNGELLGEENHTIPEQIDPGSTVKFNFRAVGKYLRTTKAVHELITASPYK